MFRFSKRYFLAFLIIFVIEVCIALFIRDKFIRPYLGDVLVVVLLYCFLRSFVTIKARTAAAGVLLFALVIETLQYFLAVELLGLQGNKIAATVLGSQFDWKDVLAYIVGIIAVLYFDNRKN